MKTYLLTSDAKACEWQVWKHLGGCSLSDYARSQVGRIDPKTTIGELQDKCIVAGREIARFAIDHLGLKDWAVVEYDIPDRSSVPSKRIGKLTATDGFVNWQSDPIY